MRSQFTGRWFGRVLMRLFFGVALLLGGVFPGATSTSLGGSGVAWAHEAPVHSEAPVHREAPGDTPSAEGLSLGAAPAGFSTHDAGWLRVAYAPELAGRVRPLLEAAPKQKQALEELLGRPVLNRVEVRVGRNVREMEQLAPPGARLPSYAAGVAFPALDLVLLTAEPRYPGEKLDLVQVFRHELSHLALHDAAEGRAMPRWFDEGLAIQTSGEAFAGRVQTLWTATLAKTLLPFRDLTRRFPADPSEASIAYAQAADVVRFLQRGDEGPRFRALIERVASGQAFDAALSDAYQTDTATLESEWREDVAQRYSFWPVLFGGSTLWGLAMGLMFWAYVRRKRRDRLKLERWSREEAAEDLRRVLWATSLGQAGALRLVLQPRSEPTDRAADFGDMLTDEQDDELAADAHAEENPGAAPSGGSSMGSAPGSSNRGGSAEGDGSSSGGAQGGEVSGARGASGAEGSTPTAEGPAGGPLGRDHAVIVERSQATVPRVRHDGGWHTLH